jgi:hypothetical protein
MKITIPENLNEITLEQFLKFKKVISAPDITDEIYQLAVVTIFCKLKVEEARSIAISDFKDIYAKLIEVLNQEPQFAQRFTIFDKEFGFIPNLDEITAGEYIDLDKYGAMEDGYLDVMGILFRPITNKVKDTYLIERYDSPDKYLDHIKNMPLGVALGSNVFFYNLSKDLLKATKTYWEELVTSEGLEVVSEINGDGINQFTQLLEETLQSLTKFSSIQHTSL